MCGRSSSGPSCDSVTFTTYGVRYQRVCGRVRGYQFASPDAFDEEHGSCPAPCNIDNNYVDGVSITHGASPRKHIWTYVAGVVEDSSIPATCSCNGGTPPPAFVGSDYYCESGVNPGPTDLVVTLTTHCGMDKIAMDLSVHAVIPQASHGSARCFLSQLLTTWSFTSVGMRISTLRILPLTLFNSTFNKCDNACCM